MINLLTFDRFCSVGDSSNIGSIAYDFADSLMGVNFITGDTYIYSGVHPDDFGKIVSSDSVGKTFNRMKHKWKFEKYDC